MLNFILVFAISNMLGGRADDVWGGKAPISGRLLFRCIIPGIASGAYAISHDLGWSSLTAWLAVTAGSALWYPFGWSFTEQTGVDDPKKYARWIRKIGVTIFPLDQLMKTDIRRATLMKGIRGMYDILTFILLSFINPWAMGFWLATFAMGGIYWLSAKVVPGVKQDVLTAEFVYGGWRGLLIGLAIAGA